MDRAIRRLNNRVMIDNSTLYDPGHVQKMETMIVWLVLINKSIGHFRVEPKPLFQNEAKCKAIDMKMNFYSQQIENHFYKKGLTLCLVLKMGVLGTRECPVSVTFSYVPRLCCCEW